jgi:hypothetical protein
VSFGCALLMGDENPHNEFVDVSDIHTKHDHTTHDHTTHDHGSPVIKKVNFSKAPSIDAKEGCCQGLANELNSLNKQTPSYNKVLLKAPVSFVTLHNLSPLSFCSAKRGHSPLITNRQRPPTIHIRIFIQSFQI